MKDFYDELVAVLGAYPITPGATVGVFRRAFNLPICNVIIHEDGNIGIDSNDDAKNLVLRKMA